MGLCEAKRAGEVVVVEALAAGDQSILGKYVSTNRFESAQTSYHASSGKQNSLLSRWAGTTDLRRTVGAGAAVLNVEL